MAWGTLSVRMLWPFMRLLHDLVPEIEVLREAGLAPEVLADPDARIEHIVAGRLITVSIARTGNPAMGIHAGERLESADFGVMAQVARTCPTFRAALMCAARYHRLQDDALDASLLEEGDRATWQLRSALPYTLPASNDFQISAALTTFARYVGHRRPPIEIHLRHSTPTNEAEYARVFQAPILYDMPHNAVVFERELLDAKVPSANAALKPAFEERARKLMEEHARGTTVSYQVRRWVLQRIGREELDLETLAEHLNTSPATLRRHLVSEGTTYRALLDAVRKTLALLHMEDRRIAIGEVAFLLGFSTQSAFGAAFRRWTGVSPRQHRQALAAAGSATTPG